MSAIPLRYWPQNRLALLLLGFPMTGISQSKPEASMGRVRGIIENEITFGALMLVFWMGAMLFTMSSQLAVYSID